ncbi:natural cytotoxicity triggering receptor 3 isoform X2 [Tupaia chinensis]|uniref:natural cytotoxicity triggering receptor 3 isoform X2 n=1 Tax=Tupaia chinensis TaxID=246437 RepID=UPI0003C91A65|nr:natural cytotoxicity triggering receptor 3 isoform X2 [Tupaia chinensis]
MLTGGGKGSCVLWVSQPPEMLTQEGATAFLPCSFNVSPGSPAIGSVIWYRDAVAPGKEVRNQTPEFRGRLVPLASSRFLWDHQADLHIWDARGQDAGTYVCTVEVLGLGFGTGNGTRLVVEKGTSTEPEPLPLHCPGARLSQLGASTALFLRAALCASGFLFVALGSSFYYLGKCHCQRGAPSSSWDLP